MRELEEGSYILPRFKEKTGRTARSLSQRRKMCWLPIDQPLLRPGDSSCSASRRRASACSVAQLLASRLRRIGDQLEKSWTAGETAGETTGELGCGDRVTGRGHLKGFLRLAVQVTLLVLLSARRHL